MSEFVEFDSIEDAFAWMAEQEALANRQVAPEQEGITWGDHWARFMVNPNYMIFGRVFTEEEFRDNEARLIAEQGDQIPGELEETMAHLRETHERGYRYSRCHSVVTPEGELGDVHIFNIWPIDHTLFEAAEKVGWQALDLDDEAIAQAELAYEAYRAHLNAVVAAQADHPMFGEGAGDG